MLQFKNSFSSGFQCTVKTILIPNFVCVTWLGFLLFVLFMLFLPLMGFQNERKCLSSIHHHYNAHTVCSSSIGEMDCCQFLMQKVIRDDCCSVTQLCLTLGDPMDCSPARLLCPWESSGKTGAGCHAPSPGDLPDPGIEARSSCTAERFVTN